jgi:hypothetical protein
MQKSEILSTLSLGNSVAEYDDSLERYFVETATFEAVIRDQGDIIAGDKGTGKTALFRILEQRYTSIPELAKVELIAAFNPTGSPVFQRLVTQLDVMAEGEYQGVWKAYLISLAGNWVLGLVGADASAKLKQLDRLLTAMGLRSADDSASTIFSQLVNVLKRPKLKAVVTFSPDGSPIIIPTISFSDEDQSALDLDQTIVRHDYMLQLLNDILDDLGYSLWVVLDRLDEAFQGFPAAEIPALRALLRTYLDLNAFPRLRLKLFVRKDLFRRVVAGGFVNLTHVNARKIEIVWEDADLQTLLHRRFQENEDFVETLGVRGASPEATFDAVFPPKVDFADNKPTTWSWMLSRIRDGNFVRPPRNLIDLVIKAQAAQQRAENRVPQVFVPRTPLINSESLKGGLRRLSSDRVEDTLLAEAGEYASYIEQFRDGKAEHNRASLHTLFARPESELKGVIQALMDLGFLEQIGESFKIPMLYRDGLSITQGKAF